MNYSAYPFIRILIPLIAGILTALHFQVPLNVINIITIGIGFFIVVAINFISLPYSYRWLFGIMGFILIFLVGMVRTSAYQKQPENHFSNFLNKKKNTVLIRLTEPLEEKKNHGKVSEKLF